MCDVFAVPNVGHSTLFPEGRVASKNGVPVTQPELTVLEHSFLWIAEAMNVTLS